MSKTLSSFDISRR